MIRSRICVAGVGAVGATVAALLASTGARVSVYARPDRARQLSRDGLRVNVGGEVIEARPDVHERPDFGVQDVLFLATKAHDLQSLLPAVSPLIGPATRVVPLVNGIPWWYFQAEGGVHDGEVVRAVDPAGVLQRAIPTRNLVGCVVYLTVKKLPNGEISALAGPRRLILGALHPSQAAGVNDLAGLLSAAGLPTLVSARIRDDLWTKVALNVATNPLSVVTEATLQEQFADPHLLSSVSAVLAETLRVARAHGAQPLSLERMVDIGRQAGPFETSMLQDFRENRRLELDAIGTGVIEMADKVGEPVPAVRLIVELCAHRAARRDRSAVGRAAGSGALSGDGVRVE